MTFTTTTAPTAAIRERWESESLVTGDDARDCMEVADETLTCVGFTHVDATPWDDGLSCMEGTYLPVIVCVLPVPVEGFELTLDDVESLLDDEVAARGGAMCVCSAIFGMPVVLNPPLCVGFVLAPLASYIISYVLTAIGLCPVMYVNVPWTTPAILSGFLASGGNIMGAVTQLICLVAATLIYIPCIKVYEGIKDKQDAEAAAAAE